MLFSYYNPWLLVMRMEVLQLVGVRYYCFYRRLFSDELLATELHPSYQHRQDKFIFTMVPKFLQQDNFPESWDNFSPIVPVSARIVIFPPSSW